MTGEISPALKAYGWHMSGFGYGDIAVKLFGKDSDENAEKARQLVSEGRKASTKAAR